MHDHNTIIGVIGLRRDKVSYTIIRQRYGIGNSGIDLIMNRYKESGLSWEDFLKLEPPQVETLIYPPKNIRKDDRDSSLTQTLISYSLFLHYLKSQKHFHFVSEQTDLLT